MLYCAPFARTTVYRCISLPSFLSGGKDAWNAPRPCLAPSCLSLGPTPTSSWPPSFFPHPPRTNRCTVSFSPDCLILDGTAFFFPDELPCLRVWTPLPRPSSAKLQPRGTTSPISPPSTEFACFLGVARIVALGRFPHRVVTHQPPSALTPMTLDLPVSDEGRLCCSGGVFAS